MQSTGPGTLSYEFRKGELDDTVTIGYVGMGKCPISMYDTLDWQDTLFSYIDRGYKVKVAFDTANSIYPKISSCVKFVGDTDIGFVDNIDEVVTNTLERNPFRVKKIVYEHQKSEIDSNRDYTQSGRY